MDQPNIKYKNWTINERNFEQIKGLELAFTHALVPGNWGYACVMMVSIWGPVIGIMFLL